MSSLATPDPTPAFSIWIKLYRSELRSRDIDPTVIDEAVQGHIDHSRFMIARLPGVQASIDAPGLEFKPVVALADLASVIQAPRAPAITPEEMGDEW